MIMVTDLSLKSLELVMGQPPEKATSSAPPPPPVALAEHLDLH